GDTFVQKSPASTIRDLAQALIELFEADNEIKVIGTRHGEKLYESLLTREEKARAEDITGYYRIPADNRDLNYKKYFVEGEAQVSETLDYNSHNTERLDVEQVKEKLRKLDYVANELKHRDLQEVR
ncbi:MAG: polysaccharide biosynthesis protein, partial [Bythopirellula sp.]